MSGVAAFQQMVATAMGPKYDGLTLDEAALIDIGLQLGAITPDQARSPHLRVLAAPHASAA